MNANVNQDTLKMILKFANVNILINISMLNKL